MITSSLTAFGALLFVLGLLFGLFWVLKRIGGISTGLKKGQVRQISVNEVKPLDARNRLVEVTWRGKTYLIAAGQETVSVIDAHVSHTAPHGSGTHAAETARSPEKFKDLIDKSPVEDQA